MKLKLKTLRALRMAALTTGMALALAPTAYAQLGKGRRILIERGLQTQGMVTKDDVFHLSTYQNANYSAINWLWESNPAQHGAAPGYPWVRWVGDENQMPGPVEQAYLSQLVALQLGDEWNLNDQGQRDRAVNWFNAIRSQWPNTILYMNNYGGQVADEFLGDFITRAQPDMLSFDTYPWKSTWLGPGQAGAPIGGQPTSWYGDLRRYRVYAMNSGVPLAVYRQTFHSIQDYDQTVYRDASPSEQNLNTYGALAFGATTFIDFTYNTGASSLFTNPGGDSNPTAAFGIQSELNRRARNLGKSLVHLVGINDHAGGGPPTTDIMFIRGQTGPNNTDRTPVPVGFVADIDAPNSYTDWVFQRNDPYLSGWVVTNLSTTKNVGRPGDVILAWMKPVDATFDNSTSATDQLYLFVVNGFTGPDGTAADYRQNIKLNFMTGVGSTIQRLNADMSAVETISMPLVSGNSRRQLSIDLDGGEGALFKFNTGDPFIGIETSADFDVDGDVDGADFLRWQRGLGLASTATHGQGDANLNLTVDAADFNSWKSQLGPAVPAMVGVPEPSAWLMAMAGLVAARMFFAGL